MHRSSLLFSTLLLAAAAVAAPARSAEPAQSLAVSANDPASLHGNAAILRAQVLLDRARFAPGEIDGQAGSNLARAVRGYQAAHGLGVDGTIGTKTRSSLNSGDTAPILVAYTLTA